MPQIQVDEEVFIVVQHRATETGYASVDRYVADVLARELEGDQDDLDHVFTPERIADLKRISAEIRAGAKTYSMDETREFLEENRKAWLANHSG